jgi:antitoxin HicB
MKKGLKYYLGLNYPITVETFEEDGKVGYSLEIPDLPGCGAAGNTLNKALSRLQDAKELWICESLKSGLSVPEPISEDDFSGKFLLRMPTKLHMQLSKKAKSKKLSLNQHVKSLLEKADLLDTLRTDIQKMSKGIINKIEFQNYKIGHLEMRIKSLEDEFCRIYSPSAVRTQTVTDSDIPSFLGNIVVSTNPTHDY